MEPEPGAASPSEMPPVPADPGDPPFRGPGLLGRAGPFAMVAVAAEASLALPPWTREWTALAVSLVLLAATGLAFLLPWDRLPGWAAVLVPLAYTGSALALTLAGGADSGVGVVMLAPLIWTALFHRPWESACVVAAIVAAEVVVSLVQSAPDAVIARRVLLWSLLGALLAVATHGLRDRIRRSQEAQARLRERVGELMVVRDRDRLAADLQSSVVQRVFAAGLRLQSVQSLATQPEVRRRVESSIAELDDAIRLLRHAIFGLESRLERLGLRQQVLRLCAGVSPVPEISFTGPVDDALSAEAAGQLLDMLRLALGSFGARTGQRSIRLVAAESVSVVVTGTGQDMRPAADFAALRDRAGRDGVPVEIEPTAGGIQVSWNVPVRSGLPVR